MKKAKLLMVIAIGIMCGLLTMVMFVQFKTIGQTDISALELMREEEIKAEIASIKAKQEEIKTTLDENNQKIEEYEQAMNNEKQATQLLQADLENIEKLLGKQQVTGEGIIITLEETETARITAVDLIELVNQLRKAGAEAISINGERVVYDTYISDIDNSFVTIRGKWQYSPYTIKAIGNITYLESGIGAKQYGYIDTKKAEGKKIEMISNASITIPKIADDIEFEYIKEEI